MGQDAPSPKGENPRALWALILGIVSLPLTALCGFGLVVGIAAVVLGWQARNESTGRGLAFGGIVTGALAVVVGAVWLVLVFSGVVDRPNG
jgi:hypothetical protein